MQSLQRLRSDCTHCKSANNKSKGAGDDERHEGARHRRRDACGTDGRCRRGAGGAEQQRHRFRRHRAADRGLGAGAVHDPAGPGALLRRPGAGEEFPVGADALLRDRRRWSRCSGSPAATALPSAPATPGSATWACRPATSCSGVRAGLTMPENVFALYQMMFAIITPALIIGAFPERVRFGWLMLFSGGLAAAGLCAGRALDLGRRLAGGSAVCSISPAASSSTPPPASRRWCSR